MPLFLAMLRAIRWALSIVALAMSYLRQQPCIQHPGSWLHHANACTRHDAIWLTGIISFRILLGSAPIPLEKRVCATNSAFINVRLFKTTARDLTVGRKGDNASHLWIGFPTLKGDHFSPSIRFKGVLSLLPRSAQLLPVRSL